MGVRRFPGGSVFLGSAIAGLHYTATTSMRCQDMCRYSPAIVMLSVVFAELLALSDKTVSTYRARILEKMHLVACIG